MQKATGIWKVKGQMSKLRPPSGNQTHDLLQTRLTILSNKRLSLFLDSYIVLCIFVILGAVTRLRRARPGTIRRLRLLVITVVLLAVLSRYYRPRKHRYMRKRCNTIKWLTRRSGSIEKTAHIKAAWCSLRSKVLKVSLSSQVNMQNVIIIWVKGHYNLSKVVETVMLSKFALRGY